MWAVERQKKCFEFDKNKQKKTLAKRTVNSNAVAEATVSDHNNEMAILEVYNSNSPDGIYVFLKSDFNCWFGQIELIV